ncbi:hypothetical protein SESBI_51266 [Sesbania bispinosa]|nr:hypothetical protein SESBI_51266 [Sesbania bispinosa]
MRIFGSENSRGFGFGSIDDMQKQAIDKVVLLGGLSIETAFKSQTAHAFLSGNGNGKSLIYEASSSLGKGKLSTI